MPMPTLVPCASAGLQTRAAASAAASVLIMFRSTEEIACAMPARRPREVKRPHSTLVGHYDRKFALFSEGDSNNCFEGHYQLVRLACIASFQSHAVFGHRQRVVRVASAA